MTRAGLFDRPPPDYRPALDRLRRETAARYTDHATARDFTLRGAPPATYEATPLFTPEPEPEKGPPPIPGQLTL